VKCNVLFYYDGSFFLAPVLLSVNLKSQRVVAQLKFVSFGPCFISLLKQRRLQLVY